MNQETPDYSELTKNNGTPLFVYNRNILQEKAQTLLNMKQPFGLTVRYAAKANSHPEIIRIFDELGLHFDASSTYEAQLLIEFGVKPQKISLSAQTLQGPLTEVIDAGVLPVATSMHQLSLLKDIGVKELAIRVNPGKGSGGNKRITVGGPSSSFGIWHEQVPQVVEFANENDIKINRLHTHIGSGIEADIWKDTIIASLNVAKILPDVVTLDIGGGYKVARMPYEKSTDMNKIMEVFSKELTIFQDHTGRSIHLEIEPGTYLVAEAGTLISRIEDIVDTGRNGYAFLRLDTGMNDILRPSMYGSQHPIEVLNTETDQQEYIVVGHNCESGDILTPAINDPESILPRKLNKATIGDLVSIGYVGAYCASMRAQNFNSFPDAAEIVTD